MDVFSSNDDRINFLSFALCQASQDTSLEYPQRVLWRNFFLLIKGSGRTLWLIAGDQDGFKKSWKSVHCFIITFLTIYFLGKIIWQLFAKMGHPTEHCLTLEFCAKNPNKKKESCHVKFLERHFSCAEYTWPLIGCYKSCTYEVTWVLTNQKPEFPRAHYAIYHDEINV